MNAFRLSLACLACACLIVMPATARESLGVFSDWGAFRDRETPRCYAIAKPPNRASAYATIGTWPNRQVRGQVYFRMSRAIGSQATIRLAVGEKRFTLVGAGTNAWASGRTMDAAIIAAMRSATRMTISARDTAGRRFSDRYRLAGVATAMDAATVGCARLRR